MNGNQYYKTNNKRIAKNTFYLYLRMLLVLVVSLFTVRIVLNSLGAEDYGINNVVGGFVTMFAFLTSTLSSASLRFFSYNIGKGDADTLSRYFTMSFWCFGIMAAIIFLLTETVGIWFLLTQLKIPEARMDAAIWVYQFAILQLIINILVIPYQSIVVAHERMNMYAFVGVLECILKLIVAYCIYISPFDKLKTYSLMMFVMMSGINSFYIFYGLKHFPETVIRKYWNSKIFKEIANYSGWTLFGTLSGVFRSQGINILLNIFFNPIVNAARAIAFQVNSQINQFVLNFYKAVQPQITKSYGAGDVKGMLSLVYASSRFCFFLILIFSLPILIETDYILTIWLKEVPENTVLFTRLVVITAIVDSTSYPLQTSISATGKIKVFQIFTGGLILLNLPVSWIFLYCGYPPESTMYVAIAISFFAQIFRLIFVHNNVGLSIPIYFKEVVIPIVLVTSLSAIIPVYLYLGMQEGFTRLCIVGICSLLSTAVMIWSIGLTKKEKKQLSTILLKKINK